MRDHDARLQAPRYDHPVRRLQCAQRRGARSLHAEAHPSRVHPLLNAVERAVPAGKRIDAILDNYATHKHRKVQAWLIRHPRWTFHFTPTSDSWLNAVEN